MGDDVIGRAAIGQDDLAENRVEIDRVLLEIVDIARCGICEEAIRTALSAPVEGDDVHRGAAQVGNGLGVFFDHLVAALKQQDRAFGAARRLVERVAQRETVGRGHVAVRMGVGQRIAIGLPECRHRSGVAAGVSSSAEC